MLGKFSRVSKSLQFVLYYVKILYGFSLEAAIWCTHMLIQLKCTYCHRVKHYLFLLNMRPDSGSKLQFSHFTYSYVLHVLYVLCCHCFVCVCQCAIECKWSHRGHSFRLIYYVHCKTCQIFMFFYGKFYLSRHFAPRVFTDNAAQSNTTKFK